MRTLRVDVQLDRTCARQQQGRGAQGPDGGGDLHSEDVRARLEVAWRCERMHSGSSTGPEMMGWMDDVKDRCGRPNYYDTTQAGGVGGERQREARND